MAKGGRPLTTGDVAKYCHVSQVAVVKWIKAGKLKAYRTPGSHYRILPKDFLEFLEKYQMPVPPDFHDKERKKRVLIVDDDPAVVGAISTALEQDEYDYEIASASDGYEAGIQVATFHPDLVILDIMMPELDGFEVCRKIKSDPKTQHIKILVLTGYPDEANIKRMLAYGADKCMAKPLNISELRESVAELLGLAEAPS